MSTGLSVKGTRIKFAYIEPGVVCINAVNGNCTPEFLDELREQLLEEPEDFMEEHGPGQYVVYVSDDSPYGIPLTLEAYEPLRSPEEMFRQGIRQKLEGVTRDLHKARSALSDAMDEYRELARILSAEEHACDLLARVLDRADDLVISCLPRGARLFNQYFHDATTSDQEENDDLPF